MRIAFLSRINRRFHGHSLLSEPMGGTQSALIHLARELAARGHEVHVFCQTQAGEYDGVHYRPLMSLARFARKNPLDVFIPVADELALELGIRATHTVAWMHNDYPHLWRELPDVRAHYAKVLATRCDKVMVTSRWQQEVLQRCFQLPEAHFALLPYGIHPEWFAREPEPAEPPRLLYTSVPNRGLGRLLDLFPQIRAELPSLELHVYSSFQIWGMSPEKDDAAAGALYARAREMEGVQLHPAIAPAQLPQVLAQGSLWTYPQHPSEPLPHSGGIWVDAETFCLAGLEAQAAGLPAVASQRGALPETLSEAGSVLIPGDPFSSEYATAFVQACVAILQDPERRRAMSEAARSRALNAFGWPQIAAQWEQFLTQLESTRQPEPPFESAFAAPEISVIIPTYNRARNLKNCLESLTWQKSPPFEVIVCDDGSSDNTREVVDSYRERLNLRYRWQPDEGFRAAEARNLGLRIARGKVLVFLDSDLVVPPSFLQAHWEALNATPNVAVNSFVYRMQAEIDDDLGLPPAEYIPKHLDILKPDSRSRYELFERNAPVQETYFLDSNALSMWTKDLHEIGGFDGEFVGWGHEDTELGYRLANYRMQLLLIREGCEAYHQYHYVSEHKDDERAVNWERMMDKHGIENWYMPLWDLSVYGLARFQEENPAATPAHISPVLEGHWELKTGHAAPLSNVHYKLLLRDGVVQSIEPTQLSEVSEPPGELMPQESPPQDSI